MARDYRRIKEHPENAYRNGSLYSSYTAAAFPRKTALADYFGVNLKGAVTWAFEFEDQPWFYGFRDLATNGVDKPVMNVLRMFGMMCGDKVEVEGDLAYDFLTVRDESVRGENPDINAFAAASEGSASVMIWHYHDDNVPGPSAIVALSIAGLPTERMLLHHYRVDQQHSNAYEVWKEMENPQNPTTEQYTELEKAGQLTLFTSPKWVSPRDGSILFEFDLTRQAISLLVLSWGN